MTNRAINLIFAIIFFLLGWFVRDMQSIPSTISDEQREEIFTAGQQDGIRMALMSVNKKW